MKVLIVFGTRPEAIKMCPIVKALKKHSNIEYKICLTAQHREMLDQVMSLFEIKADYDLNLMRERQTLTSITMGVLEGVDRVLSQEKPDVVLVHGDTTTSFAAGLASFYHQIPVGHVEAGLRTYNLKSPFPEEFNRQAVDLFTKYYFTPTESSKMNLLREGKKESDIYVTGNTVIDAMQTTVRDDYQNDTLEWAKDSKLILLTAHRRENIGAPMESMFAAVKKVVEEHPNVKLIYPMHKNPAVRELANKYLNGNDRIRLIEPLDVIDFHNFMRSCYLILTDSGGIQEEAPALGKPVLVMRDITERPEGLQTGTLKLVGTSYEKIIDETKRLLTDIESYSEMCSAINPYGDGHASERIVEILIKQFRKR